MQQALPYRKWVPSRADHESPFGRSSSMAVAAEKADEDTLKGKSMRDVKGMVRDNAVLLLGKRGCCMCHVMKRLLLGLGVNPTVCEIDEEEEGLVVNELVGVGININGVSGGNLQFPAVYIGGKLFGGLDQLMAAHISGQLTPILKQAGALWL